MKEQNRLVKMYKETVVPALLKEFKYANVNEVPKLVKIVLNMGLGDVKGNSKSFNIALDEMQAISGQKPVATVAKMDQHLFFIVISGDGSVIRKEVVRQISKTNTPLTAAINALLAGPNISESEDGYMSLIPEGSKLLGASVNNRVATINFSEDFLFNKYGVEGIYGQLMQVVYTATAFSNIDSVQFLIEGAKQEYLGEGIYVGAPLPRSVFR